MMCKITQERVEWVDVDELLAQLIINIYKGGHERVTMVCVYSHL